jgi:hypothetical protein
LQFGGVVYVMIVLFMLTIAFPLVQIFNTALSILYDLTVLAASPAVSAAEANTIKENKEKRKDNAKKEAKADRKKEAKERKKKEKKEKVEKKKKEKAEKAKKKKKEKKDKTDKKKKEKAEKDAKKKKDNKDNKDNKDKDKSKNKAGTPEEALKRLEARMDRLDRRLTRAANSAYAGVSALREFTIRELVQLRRKARESVQYDISLFDSLQSVRDDVRRRDADNVRSDLVIYRSLDQIRDRVRQLDSQLRAAMAAEEARQNGGSASRNATRVLTSRTGEAVQSGLFSNVYSATVGRVFGQAPVDYGEVTTTTSDESSDYGDSDSGEDLSDSDTSTSNSDSSGDESSESDDEGEHLIGIDILSAAGSLGSQTAYMPTEAERRGMLQLQGVV